MNHKQNFDSLTDAHSILCDACEKMSTPWYAYIPLINWTWWKAYFKINHARNYIYKQTQDEFDECFVEIKRNENQKLINTLTSKNSTKG
jgi:hypothetical protein